MFVNTLHKQDMTCLCISQSLPVAMDILSCYHGYFVGLYCAGKDKSLYIVDTETLKLIKNERNAHR